MEKAVGFYFPEADDGAGTAGESEALLALAADEVDGTRRRAFATEGGPEGAFGCSMGAPGPGGAVGMRGATADATCSRRPVDILLA